MMKLGSLFDGIGGFPLAGTRHGIEPVWASEIEPFPIKVTSVRFPAMKHLGDITKIDGSAIEPVDIITFGSPCQDLSVAGKRAGLQHTDKGDETTTRSGLFMEAVRIIKQMREATRDGMGTAKPRWAVWENVPGAYSSNAGEDFRVVLEELARVADDGAAIPRPVKDKWTGNGCVMGNGWSLAWRTLDAQHWGVPQRRRRIYLVADFAGGCAPEVLFIRDGLRRDTSESGEAREGLAADAEGSTGGPVWNESGQGYWMPGFGCLRAEGENRPSRPGHVFGSGGRVGDAPVAVGFGGDIARTLTARHDSSPCADRGQNVVAVAAGVGESPDVAHCLRAGASKADKHESTTYICEHALYENHGQDSRLTGPLDISPTVAAKFGTGGNNTPLIMAHGQANAEIVEDRCPTLNCNHEQPILFHQRMRVRRLTPLECERLQGFPDGWTDIPGASDSGRYKALGNSLAIPTAEYVIDGIAYCAI